MHGSTTQKQTKTDKTHGEAILDAAYHGTMGRRRKRGPNDELEGRKMAASEGALRADEDVLVSRLLCERKRPFGLCSYSCTSALERLKEERTLE